jgi:hypothetical protein
MFALGSRRIGFGDFDVPNRQKYDSTLRSLVMNVKRKVWYDPGSDSMDSSGETGISSESMLDLGSSVF